MLKPCLWKSFLAYSALSIIVSSLLAACGNRAEPPVPCDTADGCVDLGYRHLYARNLRDARAAFQKTLLLSPANTRAYLGMALIFGNQENRPQAIRVLRRHMRNTPEAFGAHAALAYLLDIEGALQSAMREYRLALKGDQETQLFVLHHMGIALARSGQLQAAIACFERCSQLASGDWTYPYLLGSAYEDLNQNAMAIAFHRKALLLVDPVKESLTREMLEHHIKVLRLQKGVRNENVTSHAFCSGE